MIYWNEDLNMQQIIMSMSDKGQSWFKDESKMNEDVVHRFMFPH